MSAHTNTVCAKVAKALHGLNKEILTPQDVDNALKKAGIDSVDGRQNYTKGNAYLTEGGYLIRCIGGWELSTEALASVEITTIVMPGRIAGRVFAQMAKSTKQFDGIVEMKMEV